MSIFSNTSSNIDGIDFENMKKKIDLEHPRRIDADGTYKEFPVFSTNMGDFLNLRCKKE
jgi:hypothetical protein